METILMLIAFVSFVAFIVGMFSPKTVKCSSRGKVALIFVSLFFVSAIISGQLSGDPDGVPGENKTNDNESVSQTPQEITVGTPVQIGNFVYQVNDFSFRKSVGNEFMQETADGIYLLVDLSLKNIDNESHTLDNSLFSITDLGGNKYEYSTNASTTLEMSGYKTLFLKQCQPNITTRGILIFEVPQKGKYFAFSR
ncbi:MAG: DUF4352 domain-containing protein [Odoribacter sp.]|nr:DUF4352 domain-containing protein [Odoribacter sp.]